MAIQDGYVYSGTASGALGKFHAVKLDASDEATETTANGDSVFGVSLDSADAQGDKVDIQTYGVVKAEVDGSGTAINPGDRLMPDSNENGRLISHDGSSDARFVAKAYEASSAAGDYIEVLLFPNDSNTT